MDEGQFEEGQLVESQVAYYRARAGEYDQWFLRQGRYDRAQNIEPDGFPQERRGSVSCVSCSPRAIRRPASCDKVFPELPLTTTAVRL
jgi:hypothetical protein